MNFTKCQCENCRNFESDFNDVASGSESTNSLIHITFDTACKNFEAGHHIPDGTVIVAPAGLIEARVENDRLREIEAHVCSSDWKRVWRQGIYHYTLLVARKGITELKDIYGGIYGFAVNGTDRRSA